MTGSKTDLALKVPDCLKEPSGFGLATKKEYCKWAFFFHTDTVEKFPMIPSKSTADKAGRGTESYSVGWSSMIQSSCLEIRRKVGKPLD